MQVDGKPLPDMQFLAGQLKNLPPEQRGHDGGMLAKQGVTIGGNGVRSCLTPEQVQTNDILCKTLNLAALRRSPTVQIMSGSFSSVAPKPKVPGRQPSSATRNSLRRSMAHSMPRVFSSKAA